MLSLPAPASASWLKEFFFPNEASLAEWKEKLFHGKTIYEIKLEKGDGFLLGHTEKNASALYAEVKNWDLQKQPILSWKWKAVKFPPRQPNLEKSSGDYAMRVFVLFPAKIFLNSKALGYAMDPMAPDGKVYTSSLTKNMKMIAKPVKVEDTWYSVTVNVWNDYKKAFGKEPGNPAGAVGIVVDGDSDKKGAAAQIDNFRIGKALVTTPAQ